MKKSCHGTRLLFLALCVTMIKENGGIPNLEAANITSGSQLSPSYQGGHLSPSTYLPPLPFRNQHNASTSVTRLGPPQPDVNATKKIVKSMQKESKHASKPTDVVNGTVEVGTLAMNPMYGLRIAIDEEVKRKKVGTNLSPKEKDEIEFNTAMSSCSWNCRNYCSRQGFMDGGCSLTHQCICGLGHPLTFQTGPFPFKENVAQIEFNTAMSYCSWKCRNYCSHQGFMDGGCSANHQCVCGLARHPLTLQNNPFPFIENFAQFEFNLGMSYCSWSCRNDCAYQGFTDGGCSPTHQCVCSRGRDPFNPQNGPFPFKDTTMKDSTRSLLLDSPSSRHDDSAGHIHPPIPRHPQSQTDGHPKNLVLPVINHPLPGYGGLPSIGQDFQPFRTQSHEGQNEQSPLERR